MCICMWKSHTANIQTAAEALALPIKTVISNNCLFSFQKQLSKVDGQAYLIFAASNDCNIHSAVYWASVSCSQLSIHSAAGKAMVRWGQGLFLSLPPRLQPSMPSQMLRTDVHTLHTGTHATINFSLNAAENCLTVALIGYWRVCFADGVGNFQQSRLCCSHMPQYERMGLSVEEGNLLSLQLLT